MVPNVPQQLILVEMQTRVKMRFGPRAGQIVDAVTAFVGSSACEGSSFDPKVESLPIAWKFCYGLPATYDVPGQVEESAWVERRFAIDRSVDDARLALEEQFRKWSLELSNAEVTGFQWYIYKAARSTM